MWISLDRIWIDLNQISGNYFHVNTLKHDNSHLTYNSLKKSEALYGAFQILFLS